MNLKTVHAPTKRRKHVILRHGRSSRRLHDRAVRRCESANMMAAKQLYEPHVLSESGGPICASTGLTMQTERFDDREFDTLIVLSTPEHNPNFSPALVSYVRDAPKKACRVASLCTGALVLAEAGLLDNRRATTHWAYAGYLRERFPKVRLEEDRIFLADGSIWTSAGCTACIDLCLAMVEDDCGKDLARAVAKDLVMYHRRAGSQSQYSALLELAPKSDRIRSALEYARCNLGRPLTLGQLAEVAHLSSRQFGRAFREETGKSPGKAIEQLRIETAKAMLEEGRHAIETIAREVGFGSRDRMRRAFVRRFGKPPQDIRRTVRDDQLV